MNTVGIVGLFFLALSTQAGEIREYRINDLRAINAEMDSLLADAGLGATDPQDLIVRVERDEQDPEALPNIEVVFPPRLGLNAKKHAWYIGALITREILGDQYSGGLRGSWLHIRPAGAHPKSPSAKTNYHADATVMREPEVTTLSLSFAPHIFPDRIGTFVGVKGSLHRIVNSQLNGAQPVYIPGFGAEVGVQQRFGPHKKIMGTLKITMNGTYHTAYVKLYPTADFELAYRIK